MAVFFMHKTRNLQRSAHHCVEKHKIETFLETRDGDAALRSALMVIVAAGTPTNTGAVLAAVPPLATELVTR